MGRVPYSEFDGARVRLQRLDDQQVLSGWLIHLRNDSVAIRLDEPERVGVGQRFLFQVQGASADAYFIAAYGGGGPVRTVDGATALKIDALPFDVITQIQLRDAQQLPRKAVATIEAQLVARGRSSEVLISDASAGGMGIMGWEELERGDVVGIEIRAGELNVDFHCMVRHCRPDGRLTGAYRIGLQFQNPERLALSAWRKMLNPI